MTPFATDGLRYSNVVKLEHWPEVSFTREAGVYNGTAGTLLIGTVLGKVTANGKYKVCLQAAVDGSQTPAAVLLEDTVVALNTDKAMRTMVRGPAILNKNEMTLDASFTAGALRDGAFAALEAKGILCNDGI